MEEIFEGLKILMNYGNADFTAAHDQIYTGSTESVTDMGARDKKKLEELGWFLSARFDCWSHFC